MSQENSPKNRYDVLFFLKGVPLEQRLQDDSMVIAEVTGNGIKVVENLAKAYPSFAHFRDERPDLPLTVFCYRGFHLMRDDAIKIAHDCLEGMLDAYSLVLDHKVETSKLLLVRAESEPDAAILEFQIGGYAMFNSSNTSVTGRWAARNHLVIENLLKHVDYIGGDPKLKPTPLRDDILNALRFYRQGREAKVHGIEFLAKFAALECLVCGAIIDDKEKLLKQRLGSLFRYTIPTIDKLVRQLWLLRCSASHQASVATERTNLGLLPASVANLHLDQLFAGTSYFALDMLPQCENTDELWNKIDSYSLPELVSLDRPPELTKMAVETMVVDFKMRSLGIGQIFDKLFDSLETKRLKKRSKSSDAQSDCDE
jgi:hypothetical protein